MSACVRSDPGTGVEQPAAVRPAAPRRYLTDPSAIELGIIISLTSDEHGHRWTRSELERDLSEVEPIVIDDALECLRLMEVVHLEGELVWASRCARHMYAVGGVAP